MFPRIYRCLKITVLASVLSVIFTAFFLTVYLKQHDAKLLEKCHLNRQKSSFHIDENLSDRLKQIWAQLEGPEKSGPLDAKYNVNVNLSDQLPFDREIAKTRHAACDAIVYGEDSLPNLSFVIPFYNEPLSLLLRTLHSILNRTPPKLLAEIVIVDDNSTYENLGAPLERYVSLLPKVVLVRNQARQGLIRTRLIGMKRCSGEVVVFLDAHTEVNEGWAQPVLFHLKRHPNHLIQPAVDIIRPETLEYLSGFQEETHAQTCTFSWDMRYVWMDSQPRVLAMRRSYADPVPTATIVGCTIAVNRRHFIDIGSFDENMNIWGGENLEVAMRYWLCGGAVLTHPCARIGHLFKPIPYSFGEASADQVVTPNLARVAEVWFDSYKKFFYATTWIWPKRRFNFTEDFIAETSQRRAAIRQRHKCKSFDWFLKAVTPEVKTPPSWAVWYGEIFNAKSGACFNLLPCGHVGLTNDCSWQTTKPHRHFYISHWGSLHYAERDGICFTVEPKTRLLKTTPCETPGILQTRFEMISNNTWGQLIVRLLDNNGKILCATEIIQSDKNPHFHPRERLVAMVDCQQQHPLQQWYFVYRFQHGDVPEMLPY